MWHTTLQGRGDVLEDGREFSRPDEHGIMGDKGAGGFTRSGMFLPVRQAFSGSR